MSNVTDFLGQIVVRKRLRLAEQQNTLSLSALQEQVFAKAEQEQFVPFYFRKVLKEHKGDYQIIAEIKRFSPSKGALRPDLDPIELANDYVQAGAAAISVLTEEDFFHGSLSDLADVRANQAQTPLLRKDFTLEPYQIWEAKYYGASAILLIAAILSGEELISLSSLARDLGLDVIFEVHSTAELEKILPAQPSIIGVNNRNLTTFEVSLETSRQIKREYLNLPGVEFWISESGISERAQILDLKDCGFSAFLIGESLLRSPVPAEKLRSLLS